MLALSAAYLRDYYVSHEVERQLAIQKVFLQQHGIVVHPRNKHKGEMESRTLEGVCSAAEGAR